MAAADALVTAGPTEDGPSVPPDATLAEVMAALLTSDAPAVRVVGNGAVVGSVTLDSIRAALRQEDAR
jgi:CBS domain-containing protein